MKTKIFQFILACTVCCGTTAVLTSCQDKDIDRDPMVLKAPDARANIQIGKAVLGKALFQIQTALQRHAEAPPRRAVDDENVHAVFLLREVFLIVLYLTTKIYR